MINIWKVSRSCASHCLLPQIFKTLLFFIIIFFFTHRYLFIVLSCNFAFRFYTGYHGSINVSFYNISLTKVYKQFFHSYILWRDKECMLTVLKPFKWNCKFLTVILILSHHINWWLKHLTCKTNKYINCNKNTWLCTTKQKLQKILVSTLKMRKN